MAVPWSDDDVMELREEVGALLYMRGVDLSEDRDADLVKATLDAVTELFPPPHSPE